VYYGSLTRLKTFRKLARCERHFCRSCNILLAKKDIAEHEDHLLQRRLTKSQLRKPTHLLLPLADNCNNAVVLQYWLCSYSSFLWNIWWFSIICSMIYFNNRLIFKWFWTSSFFSSGLIYRVWAKCFYEQKAARLWVLLEYYKYHGFTVKMEMKVVPILWDRSELHGNIREWTFSVVVQCCS
jgi:hypothetical protein